VIRINLLPQKKRVERAESSQLWLFLLLGALLAEGGALLVFHGFKRTDLKEQQGKNAQLTTQIDEAKNAVRDHEAVKAKLSRLRAREEAIGKLKTARTGPAAVLLELARIMTTGRGPSVDPVVLQDFRRNNPLALFNPEWDSRRLWLTSFVEEQRQVKLQGMARDGEDVSELARRMNLSRYFYDVRLLPAKKERDQKSGLDLVRFELQAMARY
jgi:type IV pilus assembly protein PilN